MTEGVFRRVYDRVVRPYLPRKRRRLNDVVVETYKRGARREDDFEEPIPSLLREFVSPNDHVVVVGGGHGVCSVTAAWVGASVDVYEASDVHVDILKRTMELNSVSGQVEVHHALVGPAVDVWGRLDGAERVPPVELPPCDVMVLDCEGAETEILRELRPPLPAVLIVEVHTNRGVDQQVVLDELENCGYGVRVVDSCPIQVAVGEKQ